MTATARIAATTGPSIAYTASIAAGAVGSFAAIGDMKAGEQIVFESSNGAGSIYEPITFVDPGGNQRKATLDRQTRTIVLNGPVDFRINKSATANAIEVVEYT